MNCQQKVIYYQMDNTRLTKQAPLQLKSRMIEIRRNNNILPPQSHLHNHQQETHFIINTHLVEDARTKTSNQASLKTTSQLDNHKALVKQKKTGRMKLRDYLHLNSIEKRTQEKRSVSSSKSWSKQSMEPSSNKKKHESQAHQSKMRQAQRIRNYENILKKQIVGKVFEEAQKLHQIQQYLKCSFQPKDKAKETFQYLYQIYNQLNKIEAISQKIGQTILQYEEPKEKSTKDEVQNIPFWEKGVSKPSKNKENIEQIIRQTNRHL